MTRDIPDVIAEYLRLATAPDAADAGAIAACFTEDGEVTDEGETRRGRDAIRGWWEGAAATYRYTVELRGARELGDDRHLVLTRLTGNFPGGTADLANRFRLRGGRIAALEISPPRPGEEAGGPSAG